MPLKSLQEPIRNAKGSSILVALMGLVLLSLGVESYLYSESLFRKISSSYDRQVKMDFAEQRIRSVLVNGASCTEVLGGKTWTEITSGFAMNLKTNTGLGYDVISDINSNLGELKVSQVAVNSSSTVPDSQSPSYDGNSTVFTDLIISFSDRQGSLLGKRKLPLAIQFDVTSATLTVLNCLSPLANSSVVTHANLNRDSGVTCSSLAGSISERTAYSGVVQCPNWNVRSGRVLNGGWDLDIGWAKGLYLTSTGMQSGSEGGTCIWGGCVASSSHAVGANSWKVDVCCYTDPANPCGTLYGAIYAVCNYM